MFLTRDRCDMTQAFRIPCDGVGIIDGQPRTTVTASRSKYRLVCSYSRTSNFSDDSATAFGFSFEGWLGQERLERNCICWSVCKESCIMSGGAGRVYVCGH